MSTSVCGTEVTGTPRQTMATPGSRTRRERTPGTRRFVGALISGRGAGPFSRPRR